MRRWLWRASYYHVCGLPPAIGERPALANDDTAEEPRQVRPSCPCCGGIMLVILEPARFWTASRLWRECLPGRRRCSAIAARRGAWARFCRPAARPGCRNRHRHVRRGRRGAASGGRDRCGGRAAGTLPDWASHRCEFCNLLLIYAHCRESCIGSQRAISQPISSRHGECSTWCVTRNSRRD